MVCPKKKKKCTLIILSQMCALELYQFRPALVLYCVHSVLSVKKVGCCYSVLPETLICQSLVQRLQGMMGHGVGYIFCIFLNCCVLVLNFNLSLGTSL